VLTNQAQRTLNSDCKTALGSKFGSARSSGLVRNSEMVHNFAQARMTERVRCFVIPTGRLPGKDRTKQMQWLQITATTGSG
jgi:hypothetical protein